MLQGCSWTADISYLQQEIGLMGCYLQIYGEYAPYQFIAYWREMWQSYEQLLGPFADLDPQLYKSFPGGLPTIALLLNNPLHGVYSFGYGQVMLLPSKSSAVKDNWLVCTPHGSLGGYGVPVEGCVLNCSHCRVQHAEAEEEAKRCQ